MFRRPLRLVVSYHLCYRGRVCDNAGIHQCLLRRKGLLPRRHATRLFWTHSNLPCLSKFGDQVMSRHNRNRHGRRVQFERYDPVLTTSPYWVDGLLLDGELRSQSMRTLLETRAPLSSPEDDLRVVIMRNLILLFRLINFYLAFIDRPEFMAVIPIDMGWSQNECINLINRYKRARMKFTPHGRTIPPTADGLSALLCRLVDNYIEAEAVNLQVDWQPRGLFQPASGRLGESCQDRRRSNPRCGTQSPCSASLSGLASHSRRRPRACGGPSEVKIATAPPSRALTAARRGTAEALPIPFAHPTSLDSAC